MKLEVSYDELSDLYPAVEQLAGQPLYVSAALAVRDVRSALRPDWERFNEIYREIITRHAERDEDGSVVEGENPGTVQLEDPEAANEEIGELLSESTEVEVDPVDVSALDKSGDEVEISPQSLDVLMDFGLVTNGKGSE